SFLFHHPSPPETYPLSLHDALPILTLTGSASPSKACDSSSDCAERHTIILHAGSRSHAPVSPLRLIYSIIKIFSRLSGNRCSTEDRKSTRLNSSHVAISYAVFCLKK